MAPLAPMRKRRQIGSPGRSGTPTSACPTRQAAILDVVGWRSAIGGRCAQPLVTLVSRETAAYKTRIIDNDCGPELYEVARPLTERALLCHHESSRGGDPGVARLERAASWG